MTNTSVNVDGHNVTANKVGEVKTATVSYTDWINASTCQYIVRNGVCFVRAYLGPKTVFTELRVFVNDLPKTTMSFYQTIGTSTVGSNNRRWTLSNSNNNCILYVSGGGTTSESYFSFSYPVADDWEESTTSEQSAR